MLAWHSSVEGGLLPKMVELRGFSRGKASLGEFTPLCFYCFHLAPVFLLPGFTCCLSPTTWQKEGCGVSVDTEGKSSGQKQRVFQFALLKHPLSKSSGCL